MAQWIRICLLKLGTRVPSLVRGDSTCQGVTKLVRQQLLSSSSSASVLQRLRPARLEPALGIKKSHRPEKPVDHEEEEPLRVTTRESPQEATKTPRNQKTFYSKKIKITMKNTLKSVTVHTFANVFL